VSAGFAGRGWSGQVCGELVQDTSPTWRSPRRPEPPRWRAARL